MARNKKSKKIGLTTEEFILTSQRKQCILPLTEGQLVLRALESENAILEEKLTSLEDLEKEMQNW